MLMHRMGEIAMRAVYSGDGNYNQGALMENVIAECLMKSGLPRYYYRNNKGKDMMELDFVTELGGEVTVIEVKSGKDRFAPSIRKVAGHEGVDRRIMFEDADIHTDDDGLEHYPLFAAAFIRDMEAEWDGPRFSL